MSGVGCMKDRLKIFGAGGQGKVIADIAQLNGYRDIVFLEKDDSATECLGFSVVKETEETANMEGDSIVAIGNSYVREKVQLGIKTVSLVHPNAVVGSRVSIGEGSVVMAGAVINADAKIGKGCIINTCSSVDHDCIVGDFTHVAVGAHLCGTVTIGRHVWVGAGAIVSNNVSICDNVTIGTGAVVIKDICEEGTYVGVPARKI